MLTRRTFARRAAALALLAVPARGGDYPTRPIRIIVGFPAAAASTSSARLLGDPMKDALGQTVIVENRTGAARHDRRQHGREGGARRSHAADGDLGRDRDQRSICTRRR